MDNLTDTYRHKGLRRRLIDEMREMGIRNEEVLSAMMEIPRHYFLSSAFLKFAYENKAFQIGAGQTISQPYTVARQTELLDVVAGEKVLEIGTGSGYQTSVLCQLGCKVFSIERQRLLFDKTRPLLQTLNYRPKLFYGDGYKGQPAFAPFDKILVTCGAPFIPEALLSQLTIGGKLIIPVGESDSQIMTEVVRINETEFEQHEHGLFAFVPMLEKRSKQQ
jgi:protein-L-isoaspartate(D-aspartate) O-methyltransferase